MGRIGVEERKGKGSVLKTRKLSYGYPASFTLLILVKREGEPYCLGKTSLNRFENQQTEPTYSVEAGIVPRPHWWKGMISHHCASPEDVQSSNHQVHTVYIVYY